MLTAFLLRFSKTYIVLFTILGLMMPEIVQAQWEIKHISTSGYLQLGYSGNAIKFRNERLGLVMNQSGIYRSTDTGETWTSINHLLPWNIIFRDFDFTNDTLIYATGDINSSFGTSIIIRSIDAGIHWDSVCTLNKQLFKIRFLHEDTGIACGYNGIYRTSNRGQTWDTVWNLVQSGYKYGQVSGMHFRDNTHGVASALVRNQGQGATFFNVLLKTSNGGQTWTKHDLPMLGEAPGLWFMNDLTGFAGAGKFICKTTDGGVNWTATEVSTFSNVNSIQFVSDSVGFAVGGIYTFFTGGGGRPVFMMARTTDAGQSWTSLDTFGIPLHSVFFLNEQTGCVAGANQLIMKTQNGFSSNLPQNYPWQLTYANVNVHDAQPDVSVIYPNPFDRLLHVAQTNVKYISICDMSGRVINEFENVDLSFEINTGDLLPGVYLLQIRYNDGSTKQTKILKR